MAVNHDAKVHDEALVLGKLSEGLLSGYLELPEDEWHQHPTYVMSTNVVLLHAVQDMMQTYIYEMNGVDDTSQMAVNVVNAFILNPHGLLLIAALFTAWQANQDGANAILDQMGAE